MIRRAGFAPPSSRLPRRANKVIWLISFTDLISLLLGFFVMLYAMAEPRRGDWSQMVQGLSARSTAATASERSPTPTAAFNGATIETSSRVDLGYLAALLRNQLRERSELASVTVRHEDDRVTIAVPAEALFERDSRALSEDGRKVLFLLSSGMARTGNRVEVLGRAENAAAGGASWEGALARAIAVAGALRDLGYGTDLVARAVAQPVTGGVTAPSRLDIVVREQEG
jgi:chemotaxis protein MotB